jgi:hypothetical protein
MSSKPKVFPAQSAEKSDEKAALAGGSSGILCRALK